MKTFKINSLQLKWYSPEEIQSFSECEVIVGVSLDKFGHPVPNGSYDLRMGPCDMETICGTCNQGLNGCPGHFGHLKIQPVMNPLLFDTFYTLLRSFCHSCFSFKLTAAEKMNFYSELECSKKSIKYSPIKTLEELEKLLSINGNSKNNYYEINSITKNYLKKSNMRLSCPNCSHLNGKLKKGVGMRIMKGIGIESMEIKEAKRLFEGFAEKEGEILKNMFNTVDYKKLTDLFFITTLIVPPNKFRPTKKRNNSIFENPLNTSLNRILSLSSLAEENSRFTYELQQEVLFYFDSSKRPKKTLLGHKQLLEKKEGLFRQNVMGKRVNYSARSVISPDPCLETGEIGVPLVFAKKLTFPEKVCKLNLEKMKQLVIKSSEYPGANYIEDKEGLINLNFITQEKRVKHSENLLGKMVHRHLVSGDLLLVNRQPTLHAVSLMGHKARVLKNEKTIRLHYVNCKPYNADFDGDEMNIHLPQCQLSRAEIDQVCSTDYNFLVPSTGLPIRGLTQDHIVAAAVMTMKDSFFTREEFTQIIFNATTSKIEMETAAVKMGGNVFYTGKQIVNVILRNCISGTEKLTVNFKAKLAVEDTQFLYGKMLTGCLDKNTLGTAENSLVHFCGKIYGYKICNKLLTLFSRMVNSYLQLRGFTLRLDDFLITDAGNDRRKTVIDQHKIITDKNKVNCISHAISALTTEVNSILGGNLKKRWPRNNMENIVKSGAKGSLVNLSQISLCLGQQELEGQRVPTMKSGKSLPCFTSEEYFTNLSAGGFVYERFLTGLSPTAFYFHCMAGREGLIDTAVKTANSGYLQRCLVKHLENVVMEYDGTVRNSRNKIIQYSNKNDSPGKSVGLLAAQSIGEPSTQMTLNTFHLAGVAGRNVTLGIPRLREIVMVASQTIRTPDITCRLKHNTEKARGMLKDAFEMKTAVDFIKKVTVTERVTNKQGEYYKIVRIQFDLNKIKGEEIQQFLKALNREFIQKLQKVVKKKTSVIGIAEEKGNQSYVEGISDSSESSSNETEISKREFVVENTEEINNEEGNEEEIIEEEESDISIEDSSFNTIKKIGRFSYCYDISYPIDLEFLFLPVVERILNKIVVREVKGFTKVDVNSNDLTVSFDGSNFISLYNNKVAFNTIDFYNSYSNDIYSVYVHFGVEACRECIMREIFAVFDVYGIRVDEKHLELIADFMTRRGEFTSFSRNSFTLNDSMIQRMSFESCYKFLKESVALSMNDDLKTPSAGITVGNTIRNGTGAFEVFYEIN
ncbi:hypothetical protein NUSPORA_02126 [Nucleospora cyclopteri]